MVKTLISGVAQALPIGGAGGLVPMQLLDFMSLAKAFG
jgi:hypothetical protein